MLGIASLNLYWNEQQWKNFLYQHIRIIIIEAVTLASKEFDNEYQIFSQLEDLSSLIGDYMVRGIISRSAAPQTK